MMQPTWSRPPALDHQARPELEIIGLLVALELIELRLLRRHQELEHEATAVLGSEKIGQAFQSGGLPLVQRAVALRVVAYQHLAEGRVEGLDMARETLAIFEIELVLSALLRRAGGDDTLGGRIAQDRGAELLVHQDAGLFLGHAAGERRLEAIVDDLLGAGDFGCLRIAQGRLPAEQLGLERAAVVEGQNVQRAVIASGHQADPLSLLDARSGDAVRSRGRSTSSKSLMRSIVTSAGGKALTSFGSRA
jgi:hypothetical protein